MKLIEDLGLIYFSETSKQRYRYGIYECSCGALVKTQHRYIHKDSKCKKCSSTKNATKHSFYSHRLYSTWKKMIDRCTNPKNKNYKDYGERGITVCEDWISFINFENDMYPSYKEGLTLDRANTYDGYSKQNCRWADKTTQSRNIKRISSSNTSGLIGVYFCKQRRTYRSCININKKRIHISSNKDKYQCALDRDTYIDKNNTGHTKNFIRIKI